MKNGPRNPELVLYLLQILQIYTVHTFGETGNLFPFLKLHLAKFYISYKYMKSGYMVKKMVIKPAFILLS